MAQTADTIDVSLATYNVHLLPGIVRRFAGHRGQTEYRSAEIGRRLVEQEIIGLCETFDNTSRQTLIQSLSQSQGQQYFSLHGPQRSGRHFINGGLLFLSRRPIVTSGEHKYHHASRLINHGFKSDGYAAKGVIYACVRWTDACKLDFFLTHLESQNQQQRMGQVEELVEFIATHRDDSRHAFLMGDLNIAAGSNEYQDLVERLSHLRCVPHDLHWDSSMGTSNALAMKNSSRIDFIFWLKPENCDYSFKLTSKNIDPMLASEVSEGSLSDHAAVTAKLAIETR